MTQSGRTENTFSRSASLGANNVLFLVEISFSQTEIFLVLNFPRKIYAS